MNTLYYGDNLHILREHIADESVDLIYLDPPFNSKRDYNVLFRTPKGHSSEAQVTAFEDSWTWGEQAEHEYAELLHQPNTDVAEMIASMRRFLNESDVMAYLVMMTNRLLELHRAVKLTGSLYLHCDPTASHYLKLILDAVFGAGNFVNEVIWKRTTAHGDSKQGSKHYGRVSDTIFLYAKSENYIWNQLFTEYSDEYLESKYRYVETESGRKYRLDNITDPGGASKGNPSYEFLGVTRYWRYSREKMEHLYKEGRIIQTRPGTVPQYKRYLDEMKGQPLQNVWTDIDPINSQAQERLGYPTQKPQALLERILQASSNPGDIVLDPFCGCGTAVHAAQKLGRQWIGIDITHLAISLIEKRLKDAFRDSVPPLEFKVHGTPKDLDGARDLALRDKYEFQYWACSLVDAQPYQNKKKGADSGIDGLIFFQDDKGDAKKIIVSVKGGEHVTRTMIADLKNSVDREKAQIGLFVSLTPPTEPMQREAVSAGYYDSQFGAFPKIQILTIEDLLSGNSAGLPGGVSEVLNNNATITADGYNLFGHSGETNGAAFYGFAPGASDINATSDGTNPTPLGSILDTTLADNGGPTMTHALVAGSPAVDAAPSGPATDQRGVPRPQGSAFDIGAFELEQAAPDTTAPTILLTTPAEGAVYLLGQAVNGDYSCQDEAGGSGLASCVGNVANGSPIDTGSVGAKSFTVNAADNAGNPASVTHNYSVIYNFNGFFQPVDNLPTLNLINAGKGVAVKFSLGGDQGLAILAAGYPISQPIACEGGSPLDTIEQTVTASSSSLSYDPATDTYIYKWKTEKAWAGTCRQLIVRLADGTDHVANFKFK